MGVWGGAFITMLQAIGLKYKKLFIANAVIYSLCLVTIAVSYPYLKVFNGWNPVINNIFFTGNEVWMCLFLAKTLNDNIIQATSESRKKADHLLELDLLRSRLYANITHEFRTPLTLIRGNAEVIKELHGDPVAEKADTIIRQSDKILFLVNQMLNLSKIEEGQVPVHYIQTDLIALVRLIVGSFQGYADVRNIRLHFETSCPGLVMDLEPEKLEEALGNILTNAIKYTPEGGEVEVAIRHTCPGGQPPQAEISVRDTGIGIPDEERDKIFIRFYRVEDDLHPFQEGTGIGLTLVKEYVKMMGGVIRVESIPRQGSVFTIILPVTHKAEGKTLAISGKSEIYREDGFLLQPGLNRPGHPLPQLLIIEDNRELCDYLSGLLGDEYQIFSAANGTDGIRQALEYIPDLVLTDVMMPGKDGFKVCRELKNDFRTSHIPVVLLTARADSESKITGIEAGADAYLTKPFNRRELKICLHNLIVQRETLKLRYSRELFEKDELAKEEGQNGQFLNRVVMILENNYRNDRYGINDLCSEMNISRMQLHRKLTAMTGQPASRFIRSFKLHKARQMLIETDKNVSDIAFESGFSDDNYFSKSFIREFGLSATELRKSFL
jgi:signal transduction histidine kinase/DNA-binding response OmpR family regulator